MATPPRKKKKKLSLIQFSFLHLSFLDFPSVLHHFPFFSLASLFPKGQQKFPGQKYLGPGGTLPPAPPSACYATAWWRISTEFLCNVYRHSNEPFNNMIIPGWGCVIACLVGLCPNVSVALEGARSCVQGCRCMV